MTVIRKTYGYFNLLPKISNLQDKANAIGSQGQLGQSYTNGGGRIIIIADSLKLEGKGDKLLASGGPIPLNKTISNNFALRNGGSGGYIYIKTV